MRSRIGEDFTPESEKGLKCAIAVEIKNPEVVEIDERLIALVVDPINALSEAQRTVKGKVRSGEEIARYLMPQKDAEIRNKILRMNCFIHSSVMYRKRAVQAAGGYTVEKMSEDHDLWLRLGRQGKFGNLPNYMVQYYLNMKGYNSQDKFLRLKQNLLFIKEHKDFYPNVFYAIVLGWAKICFYPIFNLMPNKLKGVFLKLHKKF